jgi:hypothetical protein
MCSSVHARDVFSQAGVAFFQPVCIVVDTKERGPAVGYFKNQLIANQVELGDRVPAPRPASSHIGNYPVSRRFSRELERTHNRYHTTRLVQVGLYAGAVGLLAGFFVGGAL